MSGRRIDDHAAWMGGRPKGSVLPDGAKMKSIAETEGSGHVGSAYPDTQEQIHKDQEMGIRKAESHKMKPGYRY